MAEVYEVEFRQFPVCNKIKYSKKEATLDGNKLMSNKIEK